MIIITPLSHVYQGLQAIPVACISQSGIVVSCLSLSLVVVIGYYHDKQTYCTVHITTTMKPHMYMVNTPFICVLLPLRLRPRLWSYYYCQLSKKTLLQLQTFLVHIVILLG